MVDAVITEWENHPFLYNVSHPHYYLKDKRKSDLDSLRIKLGD